MKFRITALVMIISLVLVMSSCIVTSRETHVEISCEDFIANPISMRNDFETKIGDKVYVELCSNRTTGFEWSYQMSGDPAISEEDHDFQEPEGNVPGAAGKELWTFEAIKKGTATIDMEYSQPWDGGIKKEWTYKITITVK